MPRAVEDDLTPGRYNFTRTRGDVMTPTRFTVVIDDAPATSDPVAQVREKRDRDSDLVLDLDAAIDGDAVTVGVDVELDIDPGTYWWDLQVAGRTVVGGSFVVLNDVSHEEGS